MKIFLAEDDQETAAYIRRALLERGHVVDYAADGHDGLMLARDGGHDVLVIDRMLPRLDGLTLLRVLRGGGVTAPALLLTALGNLEHKVEGLEAGADDYLVKPFAFAELYARLQALARRPALQSAITLLQSGDLVMDLVRRTVQRGGTPITLQATEFRLLEYLLRHAGQVVTRTMLLEGVWEFHFDPKTSIVETHISRLRAKIDRGFARERLQTVRGAGYRLDDTP